MHDAADHESATGATRQMQRRSLMHVQMFYQPPLGKEVRRQLNAAAEPRPHNRSSHASVETADTLGAIDFPEAVQRVLVTMLSTDGEERREGLQAGLDEEEWRAGRGA